jgi:CrcB protein
LERLVSIVALSVGGILGVNARHYVGLWVRNWAGSEFPWGTFLINVSGSFAIGVLSISLSRWFPNPHARLMIVTGFFGGYTTFSSYMMETLLLWERGVPYQALAYFAGSAATGLVAVVLGVLVGRAIVYG